MYPDRFRLPFLSGVLIAAAERRRPGLGPWSPQVEAQIRQAFDTELQDIRNSFLESFDDPAWFARIEEKIREIALPRYLVEARREADLEQRGFGILPGGKSGVGLQTLNVNQLLQAITARQAAQSVPAQESKP